MKTLIKNYLSYSSVIGPEIVDPNAVLLTRIHHFSFIDLSAYNLLSQ